MPIRTQSPTSKQCSSYFRTAQTQLTPIIHKSLVRNHIMALDEVKTILVAGLGMVGIGMRFTGSIAGSLISNDSR
jgi:hypothetical protein